MPAIPDSSRRFHLAPLTITLFYVVFTLLWIFSSDTLLFTGEWPGGSLVVSVGKGILFTAVSGLLLYLTLRTREKLELGLIRNIRQRQEDYCRLVERCQLPMIQLEGGTGKIKDINQAALDFYGYSRERFLELSLRDLVSDEPWESLSVHLDEVSQGRRTRLDGVHRIASGQVRVVEVYASPFTIAGSPISLLIVVDVTQRAMAQADAVVREAQLSALASTSPDGIILSSNDGRWVRWNQQILDMWGVDQAYALDRSKGPATDDLLMIFGRQTTDPAAYVGTVRGAYEGRPDALINDQVHLLDGRTFERISIPLPLDSALSGRAWFHRDITDRTVLERSLRSTVRHLHKLIDAAPIAILTVNPHGRVASWSKGAERILGYTSAEAIGSPFPRNPEDDDAELLDLVRRAAEGEDIRGHRINRRHRDGQLLTLSLTAVPVPNEADETDEVLVIIEDISEREATKERLSYFAAYDPLTDLLNRNSFATILEDEITSARRDGGILALAFIDLDNFKIVNDSQGHEAGDALLVAFARFLRDHIRKSDAVCRLGGDEFAILQRGLRAEEDASHLINRILSDLNQPLVVNGQEYHVNASAGISLFPRDCEDAKQLLKNADMAMYEAKRQNRGGSFVFSTDLGQRISERHELEHLMHRGLRNGEFCVYYQPQFEISTRRIVAYEALCRWRQPAKGWISPGDFIPVAEASGLISPLGLFVLRAVCQRIAAEIRLAGSLSARFAVNVSFVQFTQPNFLQEVRHLVEEYQVPAGALEFELTESSIALNEDRALQSLEALREMGIGLAIDDFGTGYSSLGLLRKMKVDRLKLDQSFIRDIVTDDGDRAIISAGIAIAHSFGIASLAEGVESERQAAILAAIGCDEAQGYLYGRPEPWEPSTIS